MPSTTPLTDAINALTTYANETTGAGDTTLSEAVNTLVEGYGQGGGSSDKWQRPADFPDYSKVDLTNQEVIYFTYKTGTEYSYASLKGLTTSGSLTYDVGTLDNGVFTVLDTDTVTGGTGYFKDLSGYQSDYVVIRVTGNIKSIGLDNLIEPTIDGRLYKKPEQYMLEVYGRLPKCTTLARQFSPVYRLRSATLYGLSALTDMTRTFDTCSSLENVYISDTVNSISLYFAFVNCIKLKYLHLNGMKVGNLQNAFQNLRYVEYHDIFSIVPTIANSSMGQTFQTTRLKGNVDLSHWSVVASSVNGTFQYCYELDSIDIHTWVLKGAATALFNDSHITSIPQADYSGITNTSQMFQSTFLEGSVTMPITADTQFRNAFVYCRFVRSITIPATYTGQIVQQAFRDTDNLVEIHFLATTPPPLQNKNAFNYGATNPNRKIYVPYSEDHSVLEAYQTASVWSTIDYPIVEEPQGE